MVDQTSKNSIIMGYTSRDEHKNHYFHPLNNDSNSYHNQQQETVFYDNKMQEKSPNLRLRRLPLRTMNTKLHMYQQIDDDEKPKYEYYVSSTRWDLFGNSVLVISIFLSCLIISFTCFNGDSELNYDLSNQENRRFALVNSLSAMEINQQRERNKNLLGRQILQQKLAPQTFNVNWQSPVGPILEESIDSSLNENKILLNSTFYSEKMYDSYYGQ